MNIEFQRRTDLALKALRVLDELGGSVPGATLADRIETTLSFLPQVMAPLIRAGWVGSDRGPGGGYRLNPQAYRASLYDVIQTSEGPAGQGRCVLRDAPCPGDEECPVHAVWKEARETMVNGFQMISAISGE